MKRIIVGYDGGETGHRALRTTIELAKALGAAVTVVSVVPRRAGRAPTDPWDDREVHLAELLKARQVLGEAGIQAELVEPHGDPAREIEILAAERGADMIVVAPRQLGAVRRMLEGSVSTHVATHAGTTVVVAR